MRRISVLKLCIFLFLSLILIYFYSTSFINNNKTNTTYQKPPNNGLKSVPIKEKKSVDRIVISFVVCDARFNESLNVIKSVLLFTKTPAYFVIFSDNKLRSKFNDTLNKWKDILNNQFDFELQKIKFPEAHEEDWMNLFSKCAAQRLFIPNLITHIDSMIYVDTDTLFLGPADKLWDVFFKMNSTQISAMALEDDNPNISWYPRFAKHPFYGKYGLNSGVMLMNLTRMRNFGWVDYVTPIMLKWKLYIPWGDQDIINIIFHYHESAVREMACSYNYRSDQCVYGDACAAAARGVLVLHGSRGVFHNNKQPAFQAIYRAIDEYEVGSDHMQVLTNMDKYLTEAPASNCGNMKDSLLKLSIDTLTNKYVKPKSVLFEQKRWQCRYTFGDFSEAFFEGIHDFFLLPNVKQLDIVLDSLFNSLTYTLHLTLQLVQFTAALKYAQINEDCELYIYGGFDDPTKYLKLQGSQFLEVPELKSNH